MYIICIINTSHNLLQPRPPITTEVIGGLATTRGYRRYWYNIRIYYVCPFNDTLVLGQLLCIQY